MAPAAQRPQPVELGQPVVGLRHHPLGVREPVGVDVVVVARELVVRRQQRVPGHRPFVRLEREQRFDRERDLGEDAQRTQPDPTRGEDLGERRGRGGDLLAVTGDHREGRDLRRKGGDGATGAVGAGRGGAGDRLLRDVAHVVQGETEPAELGVEDVQRGAGQHGHGHGVTVDRGDAGEVVGAQHGVDRRRDAGEAVAGADHLHGSAVRDGALDLPHDLPGRVRRDDPARLGGFGACPVRPRSHGEQGSDARGHH
ncbi:hypothetical protein LP418_23165 [Nocardioides sp. B-3]|nr:hypothetical protein [Nocardioides sp. B-3]UUZ58925.1 hypothetical protein LP418_23165 [Nocardioides sp. B-3]